MTHSFESAMLGQGGLMQGRWPLRPELKNTGVLYLLLLTDNIESAVSYTVEFSSMHENHGGL